MPVKIDIHDLPLGESLAFSIFSANGDLLMSRGRRFDASFLSAFDEFEISTVFCPDSGQSDEDCGIELKYDQKEILDVNDDDVLGLGVAAPDGRLLVQAGKSLNAQQREVMLRQGATIVHLRRPVDKDLELRVARLMSRLREIQRDTATTKIAGAIDKRKIATQRMLKTDKARFATAKLDLLVEEEAQRRIELDNAVRKLVEPDRLLSPAHPDDLNRVKTSRKHLFCEAATIIESLEKGTTFSGAAIEEFARKVISTLVSDRYHRLHLASDDEQTNYLASHSLTTLVLSVNIAARLNYSLDEILELAVAAFLHDIGMLKMPKSIMQREGKIAEAERRQLELHPSAGIEICRQLSSVPVSVPLVILQENERLDGSGYPRQRKGDKIHPYAKIVAVAASYDAMTRKRPYREAKHPYDAMREVLDEVHKGRLDAEASRALLETMSLFPIGSGVELSDKRRGYVLDASGKDYTRPVVCIGDNMITDNPRNTEVIDLAQEAFRATKIIDVVRSSDAPTSTVGV